VTIETVNQRPRFSAGGESIGLEEAPHQDRPSDRIVIEQTHSYAVWL
jgi:hypothetical protein